MVPDAAVSLNGVSMSLIRVDDDLLPTTSWSADAVGQPAGWLAASSARGDVAHIDDIRIGALGSRWLLPLTARLSPWRPDKRRWSPTAT
jgi:hypothetical protein